MNFIFPSLGNVIIPTDFHIFQRGGSTTNQVQLSSFVSGLGVLAAAGPPTQSLEWWGREKVLLIYVDLGFFEGHGFQTEKNIRVILRVSIYSRLEMFINFVRLETFGSLKSSTISGSRNVKNRRS